MSRKKKVEIISLINSNLLATENSGHGLRNYGHGHVLGMLRSSKNGR